MSIFYDKYKIWEFKAKKSLYLFFYEQFKFHDQLSMKMIYNLEARLYSAYFLEDI